MNPRPWTVDFCRRIGCLTVRLTAAARRIAAARLLAIGIGLPLAMLVVAAHAAPTFQEDFEAAQLRWQVVQEDDTAAPEVLVHEHVQVDDAQRPRSQAERIAVELPGGRSQQWEYHLGHAPVLDELRVTLWVKANRPGVVLAARVVLPRAVDPDSGEYRTLLVRGTSYESTTAWQRLELAEVPMLVKRQARVLRLETESPIDHREAYVESLVLVVPGGPGGTEVLTDDLDLEGVLLAAEPRRPSGQAADAADRAGPAPTGIVRVGWEDDSESPPAPAQRLPSRVEIRSSVLQIDGRPFFPRIVTYQGEPLELLAELGFNTVLWPELPAAVEQQQAERHQLWQLCPPPSADELARSTAPPSASYRRVLGWYLGAEAAALPTGQLQLWIEAIRQWDRELNRPVFVASPRLSELPHHRADVLVLGRGVWGDQDTLRAYGQWLNEQTMVAGPSLPMVVSIELSPAGQARVQAQAFANLSTTGATMAGVSEEQIQWLTRIAVSNGCRGLLVRSGEPLSGEDPLTKRRAGALALANLNLALWEPWLVGGKVIGVATSSNPALTAVVVQVEQARLVIPLEWAALDGTSATALTVPGVPESNQAYVLTPASLSPLDQKRVAGGVRVVFDPASEGVVVLTEDPRVVALLREQVARIGGRAAQLRREIAAGRLDAAKPLMSAGHGQGSVAMQLLSRAGAHLGESDRQLRSQNAAAAYAHAVRGARLTGQTLLRSLLSSSNPRLLTSYPLRPSLAALGAYRQMQQSLASRTPAENRLYGGDFEDVHRLVEFGWKHIRVAPTGIEPHVELSNVDPQHGSYCLRMTSRTADPQQTPGAMMEPAVVIHSPAVPVAEGEVLEIIGWLRIDEPLTAHSDGLQIIDSLGGPELAISAKETSGWQPFRMIRYAGTTGEMELRFVLNGLGSAQVDAVMVRPLISPPASPNSVATPAVPGVPDAQRARLFAQPQPR